MLTLPVRIGVLVPSLDPVVEHDFQRFMPAAASFHVARLDQSAASKPANDESLARMCDQAPARARPLADLGAGADHVLLHQRKLPQGLRLGPRARAGASRRRPVSPR